MPASEKLAPQNWRLVVRRDTRGVSITPRILGSFLINPNFCPASIEWLTLGRWILTQSPKDLSSRIVLPLCCSWTEKGGHNVQVWVVSMRPSGHSAECWSSGPGNSGQSEAEIVPWILSPDIQVQNPSDSTCCRWGLCLPAEEIPSSALCPQWPAVAWSVFDHQPEPTSFWVSYPDAKICPSLIMEHTPPFYTLESLLKMRFMSSLIVSDSTTLTMSPAHVHCYQRYCQRQMFIQDFPEGAKWIRSKSRCSWFFLVRNTCFCFIGEGGGEHFFWEWLKINHIHVWST